MPEISGGPLDGAFTNRTPKELRIRFTNPYEQTTRLTAVYRKGEDLNYHYLKTLISVAPVKDQSYTVLEAIQEKWLEYPLENGQKLAWKVWIAKGLNQ